MPYSSNSELPDDTKGLPKGAKDAFRNAFNTANDNGDDEKTAFRKAWAAVKKNYKKEGDSWVKKSTNDSRFVDAIPVNTVRISDDGYLIAEAFVARTGVQQYLGKELGFTDERADRIYSVYRPEDEVKSADSVQTYTHAPVTIGHPDVDVDAQNWKDLAVGEVSTEAQWVDGKLRLPLIIKDANAIELVNSGTKELSAGYKSQLSFEDGTTPEGEHYDAIQKNIRINHLAVVKHGRAGSDFRIGDDAAHWGAAPITTSEEEGDHMTTSALKTVVLGDKAVSVTPESAADVQAFKDAQEKRFNDAEATHQKEIATKDSEIQKLTKERDDLKEAQLSDEKIDELVESRTKLIGDAKMLNPDLETKGKSDADIRREALSNVFDADTLKGKEDTYIEAAFDIQVKDAANASDDPVRKVIVNDTGASVRVADGGWDDTVFASAGVKQKGAN